MGDWSGTPMTPGSVTIKSTRTISLTNACFHARFVIPGTPLARAQYTLTGASYPGTVVSGTQFPL
jgi:hypothetical protein